MIKFLFTVPNGRGLGHNARAREIAEKLRELLEREGEEYRIVVASEAKVIDFWRGFEVYQLESPHGKSGREFEEVVLRNGKEIYRIIRKIKPDIAVIDNIPRRLPSKPELEKILILRPYSYSSYARDHALDEESWGGFERFVIPTSPKYERLEELDPGWKGRKKQAEVWEHAGRIVPFRRELDSAVSAEPEGILLAYGGGGLLNFEEGKHIVEFLESHGKRGKGVRLLAGPYSSSDFVSHLKNKFPGLEVVYGYIEPAKYAKELANAEVIVNPFGYNTQTMALYLKKPVIAFLPERARDGCRMNWLRALAKAGIVEPALTGEEIAEKVESYKIDWKAVSELLKGDGAAKAAEVIYRSVQK